MLKERPFRVLTKGSTSDHGRIEIRECWATSDSECLACLGKGSRWPGLRTVAMVKRQRRLTGQEASQGKVETAYYISSLEADASKILGATRTHWSIENSLHWTLDVAFGEDDCRVHTGNAPENLAIVRHFALSLLKQDRTIKAGIKAKRKAAGWDGRSQSPSAREPIRCSRPVARS